MIQSISWVFQKMITSSLNSKFFKNYQSRTPIVISYEEINEWLNWLSDALKAVEKMCDAWNKKCKIKSL